MHEQECGKFLADHLLGSSKIKNITENEELTTKISRTVINKYQDEEKKNMSQGKKKRQ